MSEEIQLLYNMVLNILGVIVFIFMLHIGYKLLLSYVGYEITKLETESYKENYKKFTGDQYE